MKYYQMVLNESAFNSYLKGCTRTPYSEEGLQNEDKTEEVVDVLLSVFNDTAYAINMNGERDGYNQIHLDIQLNPLCTLSAAKKALDDRANSYSHIIEGMNQEYMIFYSTYPIYAGKAKNEIDGLFMDDLLYLSEMSGEIQKDFQKLDSWKRNYQKIVNVSRLISLCNEKGLIVAVEDKYSEKPENIEVADAESMINMIKRFKGDTSIRIIKHYQKEKVAEKKLPTE